jgi:hypothetical protein
MSRQERWHVVVIWIVGLGVIAGMFPYMMRLRIWMLRVFGADL